MNWYDEITKNELQNIIKNLRWVKQGSKEYDNLNDDGEINLMLNCYSGIQTFGSTDYKDHRKDTLEKLKKLITGNLESGHYHQRLHFYNSDGSQVKIMKIRGYLGGYTGEFVYMPDRIARSIK